MKFINTFEQRPDIMEELRKGQRDISEENITLKVTHHRIRSAWITPFNPEGQSDDAVVVFYCKLKTNVIDIVDHEAETEKILTVELIDDKIKCTMISCCNQEVYESKFECTYKDTYTYHEELCDAMESWDFKFER